MYIILGQNFGLSSLLPARQSYYETGGSLQGDPVWLAVVFAMSPAVAFHVMTDRQGRRSNPFCCAVYAGKNTAKPGVVLIFEGGILVTQLSKFF